MSKLTRSLVLVCLLAVGMWSIAKASVCFLPDSDCSMENSQSLADGDNRIHNPDPDKDRCDGFNDSLKDGNCWDCESCFSNGVTKYKCNVKVVVGYELVGSECLRKCPDNYQRDVTCNNGYEKSESTEVAGCYTCECKSGKLDGDKCLSTCHARGLYDSRGDCDDARNGDDSKVCVIATGGCYGMENVPGDDCSIEAELGTHFENSCTHSGAGIICAFTYNKGSSIPFNSDEYWLEVIYNKNNVEYTTNIKPITSQQITVGDSGMVTSCALVGKNGLRIELDAPDCILNGDLKADCTLDNSNAVFIYAYTNNKCSCRVQGETDGCKVEARGNPYLWKRENNSYERLDIIFSASLTYNDGVEYIVPGQDNNTVIYEPNCKYFMMTLEKCQVAGICKDTDGIRDDYVYVSGTEPSGSDLISSINKYTGETYVLLRLCADCSDTGFW